MKTILEKLWDETARIDRIILIAGAIAAGDVHSSDLNDFFDDEDDETIEEALGPLPEYVDLNVRGFERADNILEWLRDSGKLGFLIQFATPVMTPTSATSRSFSWGYYNTKWIYADTLDEAIDAGLKWVAGRRAAEDKKAKLKKGGAK